MKFLVCYPAKGIRPCDAWTNYQIEAPTLSAAVAGVLANAPHNIDGDELDICHPDGRILAYIVGNKVEYSRCAAALL